MMIAKSHAVAGLSSQVWRVTWCAAAIITITMGLRAGVGLFLSPISIDLQMGREVFGPPSPCRTSGAAIVLGL